MVLRYYFVNVYPEFGNRPLVREALRNIREPCENHPFLEIVGPLRPVIDF